MSIRSLIKQKEQSKQRDGTNVQINCQKFIPLHDVFDVDQCHNGCPFDIPIKAKISRHTITQLICFFVFLRTRTGQISPGTVVMATGGAGGARRIPQRQKWPRHRRGRCVVSNRPSLSDGSSSNRHVNIQLTANLLLKCNPIQRSECCFPKCCECCVCEWMH